MRAAQQATLPSGVSSRVAGTPTGDGSGVRSIQPILAWMALALERASGVDGLQRRAGRCGVEVRRPAAGPRKLGPEPAGQIRARALLGVGGQERVGDRRQGGDGAGSLSPSRCLEPDDPQVDPSLWLTAESQGQPHLAARGQQVHGQLAGLRVPSTSAVPSMAIPAAARPPSLRTVSGTSHPCTPAAPSSMTTTRMEAGSPLSVTPSTTRKPTRRHDGGEAAGQDQPLQGVPLHVPASSRLAAHEQATGRSTERGHDGQHDHRPCQGPQAEAVRQSEGPQQDERDDERDRVRGDRLGQRTIQRAVPANSPSLTTPCQG